MSAPDFPPVTDAMRAAARTRPGGWLYVVDPVFDDAEGEVPPEGVVGAYRVDGGGRLLEDEFVDNERYRPSPRALRLPEPTDPLDDLLQRTATGWAPESALLKALATSEIWLLSGPEGELFVTASGDGRRRSLWLFTDPAHAERAAPGRPLQCLGAEALLSALPPGVDLEVNPGSATSVCIPPADLGSGLGREA